MVKLRVLGTLDLSSDAEHPEASELLAKPKPTALLVYLLLARPGVWCRRDELAELFWPESDQQHARRALSQAIYQIRQHLGAAAIDARGTEDVRVALDAVGCDALDVRRDLAAGNVEQALVHYTGTLLPAFHLPDTGSFSEWLDRERMTLRRTAVGAALTLAQETDDPDVARQWARWAVTRDPLDSDTIVTAMTGLVQAGEQEEALRLFGLHRDAMRRELDLEPSPRVAALADQVQAMPRPTPVLGRSRPPTSDPDQVRPRPSVDAGIADPPTQAPHRFRRLTIILAIGAALVVGVQILAPHAGARRTLDPGLVAVLPFRYEGSDDRDRWLASALPVGLVPLLDGTGNLRAVAEQRMSLTLAANGKSWESEFEADEAMAVARAVNDGT
ncbi:MAG TPA: BTAD domain-containing putative transcriptional regulator [Gemmatimonadales bacterium]|nr:BTAD domain-containing putative transcriptional regulator [Gemmatimonadales bacterium]